MLLAEKKMEEIEGNMKGWDMLAPLPGKSHVECHSVGFPQGRNYSRGMWDVRNPLNKKVVAATAQKQDKTLQ